MKEFRDRVDVLFKVVLAVTGVVVGYFFSFQQQQNDDIELIVDLATADQSPKRIMGASIAKSYYEQKRIPREHFVAVFSYANSGGDQQLQAVVNTGAAAAVKKHANLRKALTKAGDSLPVRIYFHIRQEADREVARDIQRGVESALVPGGNSIVVPGLQLVAGRQTKSILKCFRKTECETIGGQLLELFGSNGVSQRPK